MGIVSIIRVLKKPRRVYLDFAGATYVSALSEARLHESLLCYGNASGIHYEGVVAGNALHRARKMCAEVLNAHAYEIYFCGSGTESCNMAVLGTYYAWKRKSENSDKRGHIITTVVEHPAVLETVKFLEKFHNVEVTYISVNEGGEVKVKDIIDALTPDTFLVSVMYANNEIGTIYPIKEIGRKVDEWKKGEGRTFTEYPYVHTDACQAANYLDLDVVRLKVHLMTVNSSKVYGPKGAALLYKRERVEVDPMIHGGGQERQLRSGTEAVPLYDAFAVALKEASTLRERESTRLQLLNDMLREKLSSLVLDVKWYGVFDEKWHKKEGEHFEVRNDAIKEHVEGRNVKRLPNNINFSVPGITSEEMILRLDAQGFAVSHKSACASRESDGSYVIEALGVDTQEALENVRVTFGRTTTKRDVERFVEAVKEIAEKYRKAK